MSALLIPGRDFETAYVFDPEVGAFMCPHCDLEIAIDETDEDFGDCGNGHRFYFPWMRSTDCGE